MALDVAAKPETTPAPSPPPLVLQLAAISMFGMMAYMAFSSVIGLIARRLGLSEIALGTILTSAGFAWMLTSQWWGRRSDRVGRLPVLSTGLMGSFIAYLLLALFAAWALSGSTAPAIAFAALLLLRTFSAVYYGAVPSSLQATVADITTADNRGRGMSLLGTGTGLGMVLGPALASALSAISLSLPLFGATLAAGIGVLILKRLDLPARPIAASQTDEPSRVGITDPRLRFPLLLALAAMLCVVSAQVTTGFFAQDRFNLTTERAAALAGLGLTCVGIALVLAQMVVRATGFPPKQLAIIGAPIAAIGFGGTAFISTQMSMLGCYFVAGFGMGFIFPAFQAGASLAVTPREQGAAFGAVNAVQAIGVTIAPLLSTFLFRTFGPTAPFIFASCLMVIVFVLTFLQSQSERDQRVVDTP
jgi:MFS transporter, DHA1 family, tetracycline resistance protein